MPGEIKKMPRFKENLGFFEKWNLRKKGRLDGEGGKFEAVEMTVDGKVRTIYYSVLMMEEMAKFIILRNRIYSDFLICHRKSTFRELINDLQRRNEALEMSLGNMVDVDTKNYRTAKSELSDPELDQDRKKLHELTINHLESKVYNETKRHYGSMIINLEEEVRLLEVFYELVSNYFNRHQERIAYYWTYGSQHMKTLPAVPPSEWELFALKKESPFGETKELLDQKRSEIKWYQEKKEQLVPEGVIEYFITNKSFSDLTKGG